MATVPTPTPEKLVAINVTEQKLKIANRNIKSSIKTGVSLCGAPDRNKKSGNFLFTTKKVYETKIEIYENFLTRFRAGTLSTIQLEKAEKEAVRAAVNYSMGMAGFFTDQAKRIHLTPQKAKQLAECLTGLTNAVAPFAKSVDHIGQTPVTRRFPGPRL